MNDCCLIFERKTFATMVSFKAIAMLLRVKVIALFVKELLQ